jgi:thiamine pyrophosphate-dependent acetolactate synthase large subunit-like protein
VVSTGARLLIDRLKAHGVDVIFGVPGIHTDVLRPFDG